MCVCVCACACWCLGSLEQSYVSMWHFYCQSVCYSGFFFVQARLLHAAGLSIAIASFCYLGQAAIAQGSISIASVIWVKLL